MPATINTPQYLLDQAKRRLKPTPVTLPGMERAAAEKLVEAAQPVVISEESGRRWQRERRGDGWPASA